MLKKPLTLALICVACLTCNAYASIVPLFDTSPKATSEKLPPFDAKMRDAFERMNNKDLFGARAALNQAIKLNPQSIDAQLAMAELERLANHPAAIESALKRASALDANQPDVLAAWARWYFAKGDFKTTEDYLRRAIAAKPDAARPYVDLGDLYLNSLHDTNRAVAAYRKATALDPKSAGAQAGLGSALLAQSDMAGAIRAFNQSATLAPNNPLPRIALGRIHASQRQFKEAERQFAMALSLQPNLSSILLERADALLLDKRAVEAIASYRNAVKADPKHLLARVKLGMALQQSGQTTEAFDTYQQALKLAPNAPLVLNNMAVLAIESKTRMSEVDAWSNKAVQQAPKVAAFLDTRAWVLQTQGKGQEAIALLDVGIARLAPSAQLNYRRGLLLEDAGQTTQAIEAYRKALSIDLNFESAKDAGQRIKKLSAT